MKVEELIKEINEKRNSEDKKTYDTKSQKDELLIMRAMMNDREYKVDVYRGQGISYSFNPSEVIRSTMSSVLTNTTGISSQEADRLIDKYEFKPNEAKGMIEFSKEFINTYLKTGRKLPLGGRDKSNVSIIKKTIPGGNIKYPVIIGKDKDGNPIYKSKDIYLNEYETVKVFGPCPLWIKEK
jgi:hypothetical protein